MWQAEESERRKKFQLRDASATSKHRIDLMTPMMFCNAHGLAQNNWRKRAHFARAHDDRFAYEKISLQLRQQNFATGSEKISPHEKMT